MQPAMKDQNTKEAQTVPGATLAAATDADAPPPASAAVDSAPPSVPGAITCKEEQKEDEEPPSFKESDDDKQKVEAPQKADEATMKDVYVTQDPEQVLRAAAAAAQTGEGLPTGDGEHHQEADLQETSATAKAPADDDPSTAKLPCQLPAPADGDNPAETDPPKPQEKAND